MTERFMDNDEHEHQYHVSFRGEDSATCEGIIESLTLLSGEATATVDRETSRDGADEYYIDFESEFGTATLWLGEKDAALDLAGQITDFVSDDQEGSQ